MTTQHPPFRPPDGTAPAAAKEPVRTISAMLSGAAGRLVEVTAHSGAGPGGEVVVLGPDGHSMEQARDRVRAGLVNAGIPLPGRPVTVSIAASGCRLTGPGPDLAVAALVLAGTGVVPADRFGSTVLIGQIELDGTLCAVHGVLPMVLAAVQHGLHTVVVPAANVDEAQLVPGAVVVAVRSLGQFLEWATTGWRPPTTGRGSARLPGNGDGYLAELAYLPAAMTAARWALEVAAAGGHHLGMVGPPTAGLRQLAQCLPTLLPDLDEAAALEVTALRSVAGLLPEGAGLLCRPPLRAPHHTIRLPALIGGGPHTLVPGAVSLAHHGVLFLDDVPEFDHQALAAMSQTVTTGRVRLTGASGTVTWPARFQLVLGARPCPCGTRDTVAPCPGCAPTLGHHRMLISLLWRRTDIRLRLAPHDQQGTADGESSAVVAARVARARAVAAERWAVLARRLNAQVSGKVLQSAAYRPPTRDLMPLMRLHRAGALTDEDLNRVLRLAWTISDLRGTGRPDREAVEAAVDLHAGPCL